MHGLIFETSVWLLAGSTRLISIVPLFLASRKTQVLQRKLCKPKHASFFFKKYLRCKQIQTKAFRQISCYSHANVFSLQKLFPRISSAQLQHHAKVDGSSQCYSTVYCLIVLATQNKSFGTNTSEQYNITRELYIFAKHKNTIPIMFLLHSE